jgi:UDP-N-acetylglucosamine enolpyruvyl transferase
VIFPTASILSNTDTKMTNVPNVADVKTLLKHMLYKEKVKQLQDEVIPVGNIYDDIGNHPFGKGWEVWRG